MHANSRQQVYALSSASFSCYVRHIILPIPMQCFGITSHSTGEGSSRPDFDLDGLEEESHLALHNDCIYLLGFSFLLISRGKAEPYNKVCCEAASTFPSMPNLHHIFFFIYCDSSSLSLSCDFLVSLWFLRPLLVACS